MSKKRNILIDGNIFVKGVKLEYDKEKDCFFVDIINELAKKRKHFTPKYTYIEIVGIKYYFSGIVFKNILGKLNWYFIYQKEENIHNIETNITDIINIQPKYLNNINMCSLDIKLEEISIDNIVNYVPITDKTYTVIDGNKYYLMGCYVDFNKKTQMIFSFSKD